MAAEKEIGEKNTRVPLNELLALKPTGLWQERFHTSEDETEIIERIISIFFQTEVTIYNLTIITDGKNITTMQEENILRALLDIVLNLRKSLLGIGEIRFEETSAGDIEFWRLLSENPNGLFINDLKDVPFKAYVNKSSMPPLVYQSFRFKKESKPNGFDIKIFVLK